VKYYEVMKLICMGDIQVFGHGDLAASDAKYALSMFQWPALEDRQ
jgi:hypothetical protein